MNENAIIREKNIFDTKISLLFVSLFTTFHSDIRTVENVWNSSEAKYVDLYAARIAVFTLASP